MQMLVPKEDPDFLPRRSLVGHIDSSELEKREFWDGEGTERTWLMPKKQIQTCRLWRRPKIADKKARLGVVCYLKKNRGLIILCCFAVDLLEEGWLDRPLQRKEDPGCCRTEQEEFGWFHVHLPLPEKNPD
ncbi:hypothetical protein MRB53_016431 [Persea americana]|uniref:Uncharacterized protein n=1 Tax=Persea americana TaxID=3435 RepID=A0ACC2M3H7_PERAE|nr:hypothetical protein MRB53_016431 [Persea americana]